MASYDLLASNSTVQVLSPTIVNDAVYCTIQTIPSNVIASITISQTSATLDLKPPVLVAFANGIETILGRGHVIAAAGVQTIDPNGLLQEQVSFTVQYVPSGNTPTSITAEALVPVGLLSQDDLIIQETLLAEAEAIIDGVYSSLQSAASG